ncbi:MAG: hypothetical protein QNJ54_08310 [Prochloraceae cyanobacterium]|nr:hypothetical protein [Prochloraceae cyanobacterium]
MWDINTGECLHICSGHTNLVYSVAFSIDAQIVASGSQDRSIRL